MRISTGRFAAAGVLALVLAGCGSQEKIAARVNNVPITEEQFNIRTRNVTPADLQRVHVRAGEFAMQELIAEALMQQLAQQKNAVPTEAQIKEYAKFAKRYNNSEVTFVPDDPSRRTDEDWITDVRSTVAYRNVVMQSFKFTDADLQRVYEQLKPRLRERDRYHLRIIDMRNSARAKEALQALKNNIVFETVALKYSEDVVSGPKGGDVGEVPDVYIPQPLLKAIQGLKPGEYTRSVVAATVPKPPAPGQQPGQPTGTETRYFLAQLVEKKTGTTPTRDEVRLLLENMLARQRDPQAFQRVQRELREFQQKATIQINIKGYDHLLKPQQGPPPAPAPGAPARP